MIDACFSLFLVHDASFMFWSAAHHCLRHLFRSFSLCFFRICFLYIDYLGASGSLGLIVNKRLDLILCLPLSPISWGFSPLVCLRAFCCLPSCILFCLGCACPFYLLSVVDWSRRPRQFPWHIYVGQILFSKHNIMSTCSIWPKGKSLSLPKRIMKLLHKLARHHHQFWRQPLAKCLFWFFR